MALGSLNFEVIFVVISEFEFYKLILKIIDNV